MGKRRFIVTFESDRLPHKAVRSKVRALLRKRIEPEPKYCTGKYWTD